MVSKRLFSVLKEDLLLEERVDFHTFSSRKYVAKIIYYIGWQILYLPCLPQIYSSVFANLSKSIIFGIIRARGPWVRSGCVI